MNMDTYIELLNRNLDNPEWNTTYQNAISDKIPIIRKNTARLLSLLVKIHNPNIILEIGTGSGYSSLAIRSGMSEDSRLISLERDKKRYENAIKIFEKDPQVQILYQDAFVYLEKTDLKYDFIFLDAQKRDYLSFLPVLTSRIKSGALLIADNFLFNGKVLLDPLELEEKYRNGVGLMREFNATISQSKNFETLFLPLDDGVMLARYSGK